jgi:hypothetical protein
MCHYAKVNLNLELVRRKRESDARSRSQAAAGDYHAAGNRQGRINANLARQTADALVAVYRATDCPSLEAALAKIQNMGNPNPDLLNRLAIEDIGFLCLIGEHAPDRRIRTLCQHIIDARCVLTKTP